MIKIKTFIRNVRCRLQDGNFIFIKGEREGGAERFVCRIQSTAKRAATSKASGPRAG
jgi:hypothetical protein